MIPKTARRHHTYLIVMTSEKLLSILRDFVPEYHHAKFGGNWTTNKGKTGGGGIMCLPSLYFTKILQPKRVKFGGCLFCQVIGVPVGTNCAPLLADLFLYSYESEFLDNMIRSGFRKLARSFSLCYRYIDDLIVFNNKKFGDYVEEIYPSQLTVEKANISDDLANYLDLTSL